MTENMLTRIAAKMLNTSRQDQINSLFKTPAQTRTQVHVYNTYEATLYNLAVMHEGANMLNTNIFSRPVNTYHPLHIKIVNAITLPQRNNAWLDATTVDIRDEDDEF